MTTGKLMITWLIWFKSKFFFSHRYLREMLFIRSANSETLPPLIFTTCDGFLLIQYKKY